jgi:glycosyltransferase involved in cell wall biosynthesis
MATSFTLEPGVQAARTGGAWHIVHGVLALDVGGLERIVLDLIRAGRRAGHRVSVVCVERPGALAAEAQLAGANVISLDKPPGRVSETVSKAGAALAALRPEVIHTHQIGALWYLGQAARSERIPVLHTEHGNHLALATGVWRRVKTRLFWRRAARLAGRFCCVSDDIARTVGRWWTVPRGKVVVVPNGIRVDLVADRAAGVAVRESLGIPAGVPVIGTVGRLNEVKRQELLLRAAARLPEVRVLLVGDGPVRAQLEQEAIALGIRDRVVFAGYQSSPERFLQAMDVFALTSRSEGLPVSLLEAWAAGLPVVCSAVGGIPKVVTDGETGLLFASGNLDGLTAALATVLTHPELAQRLGQAGQTAVRERYSLERMAADYERLYRTLLATPTRT